MRTPITYYGGKQRLAKTIIEMMPQHKIYVEPYFGGGALFFAKKPSKVEVINDKDKRLITFYRQVVDNFEELQGRIRSTLHSEAEWLRARRIFYGRGEKQSADVSDLDIAWSCWVLCNMSYSSSPNCGYKWDNTGSTSNMLNEKRKEFSERLHKRLSLAQISCRDAITVIEQRDSINTFFYIDPPYVGSQQQHYAGFKAEDLNILLTTLSMLKCKFILSHFWNENLKEAVTKFDWNVKEIRSLMTVSNNCRNTIRKKTELLIYNYDLENELF